MNDEYENQKVEINPFYPGNTDSDFCLVSPKRRFVHYFIDRLVIFVIRVALFASLILFFGIDKATLTNSVFHLAIGFVVLVWYYFVMELLWGRTLGKFLTGTFVVDIDGQTPRFKVLMIRTLSRLIPFEAFSCLSESRGWHDRFSATYVVRKNPDKIERL